MFNVRSKAPNNQARGVQFWNQEDKISAVIKHSPDQHDIRFEIHNEKQPHQANVKLHLTQNGFLGLGSKDPEHQIDATNSEGVSALRLEGRVAAGSEGADSANAAVRLGDAASHQCANIYFNAQRQFWGLSFSNSNQKVSAAEGSAVFQVSSRAPAQTLVVGEDGQVSVSHVGPAINAYPRLRLRRARGPSAQNLQIVLKDDVIGEAAFDAYDGNKWSSVASLMAFVDSPVEINKVSGHFEFRLRSPADMNQPVTKLSLTSKELKLADTVNLTLGRDGNIVMNGGSLHLKQKGSLYIDGNQETIGKSTLHNGLTLQGGDLEITKGNVALKGPAALSIETGDLTIDAGSIRAYGTIRSKTGLESSGSLKIGENAQFDADVHIQGSATIELGGLEVGGDVKFSAGTLSTSNGEVSVTHSLRLSKGKNPYTLFEMEASDGDQNNPFISFNGKSESAVIRGSMAVSGSSLFGQSVGVEGDLLLGKTSKLNVPGNLAVGSEANFAGDVLFTSPTDSTSPDTGALVVQGGLGVDRSITVGESILFGSPSLGITGIPAESEDDSDALEIQGNVLILDALTVQKGFQISNEKGTLALNIDSTGHSTFFSPVRINETLVVGSNGITSDGNAEFRANLTVTQDMLVAGNFSALGHTSARSLSIDGHTLLRNHTSINGTMNVTGLANFSSGAIYLGSSELVANKTGIFIGKALSLHSLEDKTGFQTRMNVPKPFSLTSPHGKIAFDETDGVSILANETLRLQSHIDTQVQLGDGSFSFGKVDFTTPLKSTEFFSVNASQSVWPSQGVSLIEGNLAGLSSIQLVNSSLVVTADAETNSMQIAQIMNVSETEVTINGTLRIKSRAEVSGRLATTPRLFEVGRHAIEEVAQSTTYIRVHSSTKNNNDESTMSLPEEATDGDWFMLQNMLDIDLLVQTTSKKQTQESGLDPKMIRLTPGQVSLFIFDGNRWQSPHAPEAHGMDLQRVRSLTAEKDLHIGSEVELAAGRLRATKLATDESVPESSSLLRASFFTSNGTLTTDANTLVLDEKTQCLHMSCIQGLNVSDTIEMNGNLIRNVVINGAVLHNISELHVGFGGVHSAGGIAEASDARLKEDIVVLDGDVALQQVRQLQGVTYRPKTSLRTSQREIGFLAQDVQRVVPEVVSTHSGLSSQEDMLAVQYSRLVPLLVESIKKLEERVATLESELHLARN